MNTKDLILEKTLKLILDKGTIDISISEIRNCTGLTTGGIYYHFSDKNDIFEAGCEEITKDDVIERMIQWNMENPDESFMEAFMADANGDQKVKYGKKILYALADKAHELGIDLSKDEDYIKCKKEMDSWFYVDNGVADNYNALIKKIAAKMGYQYDYKAYSMF